MLDLKSISLQFDAKLEAIKSYDAERSKLAEEYRKELEKMRIIDPSLNEKLLQYSGAKLLEPGKLILPFPFNWKNRHEALEWVDSVLSGVAVGAVDGSQIYSDKNYEMPLAVIQTSRIFNRHTFDGNYKQEIEATIITPNEFDDAKVYSFGSEYIDARRFEAECDCLIRFMREYEGLYVLLDGTLILSHIKILSENIREIYIRSVIRLLEASEDTKNPVIGFIDTTMPRDITLMMHHLLELEESKLSDTHLFSNLSWGERTAAFLCDRDDRRGEKSRSVLDYYERFRNCIAFFYMKVSGGLPVRVEFPLWAYEEGLTGRIADIIRAECVIRGNYPDILMRAHDAALIRMSEHTLFYGMLDNFCKVHGIKIHKSAKHIHKIMNRK